MKDMLDAGVHFGHQTQRWNPEMKPFVFTSRGGIHIIDLQKTVPLAKLAVEFVRKAASEGKKMIFVGTKKQAVEPIKEAAEMCGQFYVTKRWLGGTLTNFATIKTSVDRLKKIDRMREKNELEFFSKKERSKIDKEYTRLLDYLDGIREMKDAPGIMFVSDITKEHIAVAEAKRLKIPVVAIADTNSNPNLVDYPIPGNDDAIRSIKLFATMLAEAYNEGAKEYKEKRAEDAQKASEEKTAEAPAAKAKEAKTGGPDVVKVFKGTRKLVAAGTAEEVEIAMELDKAQQEPKAEEAVTADTEKAKTEETTESKGE